MQQFFLLLVMGWALSGCVESKTFRSPDGFELHVPQELLRLNEGEQRSIPISVVRGEARVEAIQISVGGLPQGVTADAATIEAGSERTELVLHASGAALHTEAPITITASGRGLDVDARAQLFIAGRSGAIDTAYGTQGVSSLPLRVDRILELKSGGSLLLGFAGITKMVKLTAEGRVDESFANGGYLTPEFPNGLLQEQSSSLIVVESSDGKILLITALDDTATAARPDALSVTRYLADGSLDRSYGNHGHVLDPVPNRPYGAAMGIEGELLVWNGAANDSRLTRILPNGGVGTSSPTFDTSALIHVAARLIVQADGKAVIPAYEPGLKPALYRFDTSLRMDTSFGQNGKLSTNIAAFGIRRSPGGGYVAASLTGEPAMPAVMRFDDLWRPLTGFESGRVSFPFLGSFVDSVSLDGATLALASVNNAARIGRVTDSGMIDSSYGVEGMASITPLGSGDFSRAIDLASDFGLFVFVSRNASQSTDVIRVWQ